MFRRISGSAYLKDNDCRSLQRATVRFGFSVERYLAPAKVDMQVAATSALHRGKTYDIIQYLVFGIQYSVLFRVAAYFSLSSKPHTHNNASYASVMRIAAAEGG
jgi:hypothetical protein